MAVLVGRYRLSVYEAIQYTTQCPDVTCSALLQVVFLGAVTFMEIDRLWGHVVYSARLIIPLNVSCVIRYSLCNTKINQFEEPFNQQKVCRF
jgi:hypothetical protein